MLFRMWNKNSLPAIGNAGTATAEDSLVVSYKTKHTLSKCGLAIVFLAIYPK